MAYLFLYIRLEAGAFGDTNEPEYAYESNEMKGSNPCLRGHLHAISPSSRRGIACLVPALQPTKKRRTT